MKINIVEITTPSRFMGYWNWEYGILTKEPFLGPERPTQDELNLYYGKAESPFDGSQKKRRYWKKVVEQ